MASVYWPYAIYFIKVGQSQLAQKLTTPSSNFYITYYFKYDPNKQIFSHSVLTYFAYHTKLQSTSATHR